MSQDEEHLRLLSIFHYIAGGLTAVFALFPLIHLAIGLFLLLAPERLEMNNAAPRFVGWLFVIIPAVFIVCGLSLAVCMIVSGRFLAGRRHYLFCLVTAGVECIVMPFGTVLGVFTIVVLTRDSVKGMFPARRRSEPLAPDESTA